MIEIHELSKRYGRREALRGVSLTLQAGEITLLLGANGAGKSTLLRCVLGIDPHEGDIRVAGLRPDIDGTSVRARIGYMPQSGGLHPDLTVDETIRLYAAIRRAPTARCAALLEEAALAAHAGTKVGELSGGMRQRLGFAIALISDPSILVLDEPSASLDNASRRWLAERLQALAAAGRCIIVSTHAGQELLGAAHRRIVLEDGRVVIDEHGPKSDATARSQQPTADLPQPTAVPLARKELRDAIGNRWLIGYAVLLGALGLAATASGMESTSGLALQAFGRTTAALINLCLLLSPLVAVLIGAAAVAGERERGTLEHLLAQPLSRTSLLLAKHGALLVALTAATCIGFTPAGLLIGVSSPELLAYYAVFPLIAALAGAAMAGIGLLISVCSRSAAQAQGTAVFVWFALVLLYDLIVMGSLVVTGLPVEWLAGLVIANPVDAARVLSVLALEPDLYLLGPAGAYLAERLSWGGTAALLTSALTLWTILPVAGAIVRFTLPSGRRLVHVFRRPHRVHQKSVVAGNRTLRTAGGDRVHRGGRLAGIG